MAANHSAVRNSSSSPLIDNGNGKTLPITLDAATGNETAFTIDYTTNKAAGNDTGLLINQTDTASPGTSLFADFQVGGISQFSADNAGSIRSRSINIGNVTVSEISLWSGALGTGNREVGLIRGFGGFGIGLGLSVSSQIEWGNNAMLGAGIQDLVLLRDAANTFAQRNGTNAQTFNLYNTYTDASNYQRLTHKWNTSTSVIHNEGLGTGADGSIAFNDAALSTTATKGFVMMPTCAGAPTGTPADIPTGQVPFVFDTTNNKIYIYDSGWISTAALA